MDIENCVYCNIEWEPLPNECARGVRAATVKTRPARPRSCHRATDKDRETIEEWRVNEDRADYVTPYWMYLENGARHWSLSIIIATPISLFQRTKFHARAADGRTDGQTDERLAAYVHTITYHCSGLLLPNVFQSFFPCLSSAFLLLLIRSIDSIRRLSTNRLNDIWLFHWMNLWIWDIYFGRSFISTFFFQFISFYECFARSIINFLSTQISLVGSSSVSIDFLDLSSDILLINLWIFFKAESILKLYGQWILRYVTSCN